MVAAVEIQADGLGRPVDQRAVISVRALAAGIVVDETLCRAPSLFCAAVMMSDSGTFSDAGTVTFMRGGDLPD